MNKPDTVHAEDLRIHTEVDATRWARKAYALLGFAEGNAAAAAMRAPGVWRFDPEKWGAPGTGLVTPDGAAAALAVSDEVSTYLTTIGYPAAVLRMIRAAREVAERHIRTWHFDKVWMCLHCGNLTAPCADVRSIVSMVDGDG